MGFGTQACIDHFAKNLESIRLFGKLEGISSVTPGIDETTLQLMLTETDNVIRLMIEQYRLVFKYAQDVTAQVALKGSAFDWQAAYANFPCGG